LSLTQQAAKAAGSRRADDASLGVFSFMSRTDGLRSKRCKTQLDYRYGLWFCDFSDLTVAQPPLKSLATHRSMVIL